MGSGFRDRREHFEPIDLWPWVAVAVVVACGLAFLSRWFTRKESQRFYSSPRGLARALCHAHDLDRSDERFLAHLARIRGFDSPVELFLNPQAFEMDEDSPDELRRHAEAIAALGARLFGDPSASDQNEDSQPAESAGADDTNGRDLDEYSAPRESASDAGPGQAAALGNAIAAGAMTLGRQDASPDRAARRAAEPVREGATSAAWAPAPSLFQPIPATLAAGKAPSAPLQQDPVGEDRVPAEQRETSFSELQAVRALESLMRQIRASNPGANSAERDDSPAPRRPEAAQSNGPQEPPARTPNHENSLVGAPLDPNGVGQGVDAASAVGGV